MQRSSRTWMVAALAAVFTVPGIASAQHETHRDKKPMKNIVQVAIEAGSFNTLVAAVKAAGLVETLSGPGPFTVFAPTDAAFAKLPAGTVEALLADKQKLTSILTYHVVPGRLTAGDIQAMAARNHGAAMLKTVQGEKLTVKRIAGNWFVIDAKGGKSRITIPNVMQSNGVIHVIDTVLMP